MHRQRQSAFTLIELLVSVAIIAMLATLFSPAIGRVLDKAQSARCAGNLRTLGGAVQLYTQDNDNRLPTIEPMPSVGVYPADEGAGSLLGVLGPYGITEAALRCPCDIKGPNYFAREGSSYMWRPIIDDELITAPKIYHPRRGEFVPPISRIRLLSDFTRVHRGRVNCLMGDGRVRMF